MPLFITEQDVTELLTMEDALAAVESVFKSQAVGDATNEPRRRLRAGGAVLQVMSGAVANFEEYKGLLGLKSYVVTRNKARFYVNLYDAESGELLAFIEADKLGQMRTGAASGLATSYLARDGSKTVGVYGTGWQAISQLEAVWMMCDLENVRVYSRAPENRARFCNEMGERYGGLNITPGEKPEEAAEADIIITITSSRDPVLQGAWLRPGTHINAAGGNSQLRRELDDEVIRRSSFIAVDSIDQAKLEAGELITAVEKGILTWERLRELRYVVSGETRGRTDDDQITLFKSLGVAIEDVATAAVVYRKAREQNVGKEF